MCGAKHKENYMSATKLFDCSQCGAFGKIILKQEDCVKADIVYCPACSADISIEEESYEDESE